MALPINIGELLKGNTVEWDRIEFKQGWNPEEVVHTLCAFANDINNWGGGYIFIGIGDKDGQPILPPMGISPGSLDSIQKDLLSLCHKLHPHYLPVSQPYELNGRSVLVIWAPGGDNRPYRAPSTLGAKGQHRYYVRRGSVTVPANEKEERKLLELAKRIPFDDRVAHAASIEDLDFGLIRSFLDEVKSDLRHEAARIPLPQLAEQMRISGGPTEAPLPLNVGLLFFTPRPDRWFRGATTDVVFYESENGRKFTEKSFQGPLHLQLRAVLSYIQPILSSSESLKFL